jgi:hypothetical protein
MSDWDDVFVPLYIVMYAGIILVPLGLWKLIEIIIWLINKL